MPLSDITCRKAVCPPEKALHRLADQGGLCLDVMPSGAKLWRYRYRFAGKEKMISLGAYPVVSLANARALHLQAREQLALGKDPSAERRAAREQREEDNANTFERVARLWWEKWRDGKNERHAAYTLRRMEADVFPRLGKMAVKSITAKHLKTMAQGVEARGVSDLAYRTLQIASAVLRFAVTEDLIERSPATDFRPGDILKPKKTTNFARIDAAELPELLRKIEAYQGSPYTRLAMKLMCLSFVRTSELIGARWEEFDFEAGLWRIPGERMKMKTAHLVPLAPQTVELLQALQTLSNGRALLFPGERDHEKPMSNNTVLAALARMGYKGTMTGHGFRGLASTILHEHGFADRVIEAQLAHQKRDKIAAAYDHSQHLAERRKMMLWWADYLDQARRGAQVIALHSRSG